MGKNDRRKIIEKLIEVDPHTKAELDVFKRKISREQRISFPGNVELLRALKKYAPDRKQLETLLRVRPVRSLSGIVNVSVLTKPYPCPGNCLYCPNEAGFPKSYLSGEPAAERARRLKFNPYAQTRKRLENLAAEGHDIDKVELRVIGGTWSFYPAAYQKKFIAACFAAGNQFRRKKIAAGPLEFEQKKNEAAKCRVVGISVETRPDYINEKEILRLRELGVTRVELGIQSIYDEVLDLNRRGHGVAAAIAATKLLKDAGFKVSYQIMLNLYGSSPKRDLAMAKEIFSNPDFRPDLLKIYPCAVLPEAPLYEFYQTGKYKPYSDAKLIEVIKEIKKGLPPWVRVERIIRDIPSPRITAGTKGISNLRQIIANDMEREGWHCQCIRCREVKGDYNPREKTIFVRRDYQASQGKEIFLSFENEDETKLFSLLRLRITGNGLNLITGNTDDYMESSPRNTNTIAIIREIHTYGIQTPIDGKGVSAQHIGLGKKLIKEAEKIAQKEFGAQKIAAISGVGARQYWRKNGYKLKNTYMVKKLKGPNPRISEG